MPRHQDPGLAAGAGRIVLCQPFRDPPALPLVRQQHNRAAKSASRKPGAEDCRIGPGKVDEPVDCGICRTEWDDDGQGVLHKRQNPTVRTRTPRR